jgi:putative CocE/NonD family hydrolase
MESEKGSQPIHSVRPVETVFVPMRDGVRLAVDIYRPDAEGQFPALLAYCVYGKDLQVLPVKQPQGRENSLVWDGTMEAGNTEYFVSRGYVHVIADVRGCGDSEGEYVGMCGHTDGEDGYDLIEWIAAQPWCDGNVGMVGISYLAAVQTYTAIEQPPHLKAIFPWEVWSDLYTQIATSGGVINPMMYRLYSGRGMDPGQTNGSGMAHKNYVCATVRNTPPEELDKLWKERLKDPDLMVYSIYWSCLRYPTKSPLFADFLFNPNDGPFYQERSIYTKFDKIKVPFFTGGPWVGMWPEGAFDLYNGVDAPKKIIMAPLALCDERPWYQLHDEVIRWMDHWLKGLDTGFMDEPPIKFFMLGANEWRYEHEWPLARTQWTKLYLRSRGRLMTETPLFDEGPDCFVQQPLDETSEVSSVKYTTTPFNKDTEVIGPMALYLYASIDQEDTNWHINVSDVDEQGNRSSMPTTSWLKASHRAIDESRSNPWDPRHIHTENAPVTPGKIYEYAIGLSHIANLFRTGHRLEIEISSMDNMPGGLHLCSSKTTMHKIHHNQEFASYLLLPVIPGND